MEFQNINSAAKAIEIPFYIIHAILYGEYCGYHFEIGDTPDKIY